MTYYGSKELAASFRTVRDNTLIIAEEIPEDKYSFSAAAGTRTVGSTLVHIAVMTRLHEQIHFTEKLSDLSKFDFFSVMGSLIGGEQIKRSKSDILALLRTEGDKFEALLKGASDDFLGEQVTYPPGMTPPVKSRMEML